MTLIATASPNAGRPPVMLRGGVLGALTLAFLFGAFVCAALVAPACCSAGPWIGDSSDTQLRWLAAAWLLATGLYTIRYRRWLRRRYSRWHLMAMPLLASLALVICSWPYLVVADALAGTEAVRYHGEVTDKWLHRSRTTTYGIVVRDDLSGEKAKLRVFIREYEALQVGDRAQCDYRRGRLGLVFSWRWEEKRACAPRT